MPISTWRSWRQLTGMSETRTRPRQRPGQGRDQAKTWPRHGQGMALVWSRHGPGQAKAWPRSGKGMARTQYRQGQDPVHGTTTTQYPVPGTHHVQVPPRTRTHHPVVMTEHAVCHGARWCSPGWVLRASWHPGMSKPHRPTPTPTHRHTTALPNCLAWLPCLTVLPEWLPCLPVPSAVLPRMPALTRAMCQNWQNSVKTCQNSVITWADSEASARA